MTMEEKINQILGQYYLEELTHHETIDALVALISDSNQQAVAEEREKRKREINYLIHDHMSFHLKRMNCEVCKVYQDCIDLDSLKGDK